MSDRSESEVVAHFARLFVTDEKRVPPAVKEPWTPIEVYGEYNGERVEGKYLPATKRLTVTTGTLAGQSFKSPSGAARAVVAVLNPERTATQTNGWRFWHDAETLQRIE